MFIFTAKFNKKKAVLAVLILAAVLIAIILIAGGADRSKENTRETAALSAVVKNNEQRVNYLKALGWEVDQNVLEQQKIVIPREFTDIYKKYNEIQQAQGFDLSRFGGENAVRYTYKILNYPEATGTVVADIIVCKNEVIAGDVQCNALDGFMAGLEFPKAEIPGNSSQTLASDDLTAEEVLASEPSGGDAVSDTLAAEDASEELPASP